MLVIYTFWICCYVHSVAFSELIRKVSQCLAQFKIFSISSWFLKLIHPSSSSVRVLQAQVNIYQLKSVPDIIIRVHQCTVDITYSKQTEKKKLSCRQKSGQTCRIKSSHTCLAMNAQKIVGLLCFVSSGSNVAVP